MPDMFHEGDLQSGIALAIQESKSVVCFVKDDSEESSTWEHEWLQDANVPYALARRAVTLRLNAGSEEAGYLTAFCPVSQTPTLVVIRQGQLEDQINSGTGKNDFTLRLMRAINPNIPRLQSTATNTASNTATAPASGDVPSTGSTQHAPASSDPSTAIPATSAPSPSEPPTNTSTPRDPNRDKRRKPPDPEPVTSNLPPRPPRANDNYAQEQVQRKQEAQAERDRVRRLVEADKLERRRVREEQEQRRSSNAQEDEGQEPASPAPGTPRTSTASSCNLQVRLADGGSLRQRFAPTDTIAAQVRPWIDASRRDSHIPYTLKLLRTPLPSQPLTDSDELLTLQELNLLPSATLILVPVRTFSGAYRAGGTEGFMRGLPALLWSSVTGSLGWVFGYLPGFLNIGVRAMRGNIAHQERRDQGEIRPAPSREQRGQTTGASDGSGNGQGREARKRDIRIRTLRDQADGQDDRQFYNGNQLNFEPNKDADDKK